MTDQREEIQVPPPAYAFAPFYVDQDKSWASAWEPFRNMYLPGSAAALVSYHSGQRPNEYYLAQAERSKLGVELKEAQISRKGLSDAIDQLKTIASETAIYFDLFDFEAETSTLIAESTSLYDQQIRHRARLSNLVDMRALWRSQAAVSRAALSELDDTFKSSVEHPQMSTSSVLIRRLMRRDAISTASRPQSLGFNRSSRPKGKS
jgi:hypothetical protein